MWYLEKRNPKHARSLLASSTFAKPTTKLNPSKGHEIRALYRDQHTPSCIPKRENKSKQEVYESKALKQLPLLRRHLRLNLTALRKEDARVLRTTLVRDRIVVTCKRNCRQHIASEEKQNNPDEQPPRPPKIAQPTPSAAVRPNTTHGGACDVTLQKPLFVSCSPGRANSRRCDDAQLVRCAGARVRLFRRLVAHTALCGLLVAGCVCWPGGLTAILQALRARRGNEKRGAGCERAFGRGEQSDWCAAKEEGGREE